jgi:hypothetical protein
VKKKQTIFLNLIQIYGLSLQAKSLAGVWTVTELFSNDPLSAGVLVKKLLDGLATQLELSFHIPIFPLFRLFLQAPHLYEKLRAKLTQNSRAIVTIYCKTLEIYCLIP